MVDWKKISRAVLVLSVVASLVLGLQAAYIDLYNPGSPEARKLNNVVDSIFVLSLVAAVPLLYDKYKKFVAWYGKYQVMDIEARNKEWWKVLKPLMIQVVVVVVLVVITSVLLAYYWQIPPEVIADYKEYYSRSYMYINGQVGLSPENINISSLNNISINVTDVNP